MRVWRDCSKIKPTTAVLAHQQLGKSVIMSVSQTTIVAYLAQQPQFDSTHLRRLMVQDQPLGWLEPRVAEILQRFDARFEIAGSSVRLNASLPETAVVMTAAALHLRELGLIKVWRNELYAVHPLRENGELDTSQMLFTLERGAFRRFGLCSRAAHINGLRSDGNIWLGQRASTKGIDPNKLDNLAAGGIPHNEPVEACVVRELFEEAGIPALLAQQAQFAGMARSTRNEIDGTHDEILYCYDLHLDHTIEPINQDGEVAQFLCLSPQQVLARLPEMTWDAGLVMAQCLQKNHPNLSL
jgi:8-oxo-dGTP pyrophosphatase MutT (NUDIX family)